MRTQVRVGAPWKKQLYQEKGRAGTQAGGEKVAASLGSGGCGGCVHPVPIPAPMFSLGPPAGWPCRALQVVYCLSPRRAIPEDYSDNGPSPHTLCLLVFMDL